MLQYNVVSHLVSQLQTLTAGFTAGHNHSGGADFPPVIILAAVSKVKTGSVSLSLSVIHSLDVNMILCTSCCFCHSIAICFDVLYVQ